MRPPEKLDQHHYLSLVVCLGLRYKLDGLQTLSTSICTSKKYFGDLTGRIQTDIKSPENARSLGKLGILKDPGKEG